MVEIALSLAIIGFALVAIIGVLPIGMQVQKDNRQETIINQDASFFLDAIRNGAQGVDDLTNYVVGITNWAFPYKPGAGGVPVPTGPPDVTIYTPGGSSRNNVPLTPPYPLSTGYRIVGLLSTPKFTPLTAPRVSGYYSNYVVACVRSLSGPTSEKFPQTNAAMADLAFTYRLMPQVVPCETNYYDLSWNDTTTLYLRTNLYGNLHDLRLLFRWPLLNQKTGRTGTGRQVYRTLVGGSLQETNEPGFQRPNAGYSSPFDLYFFQPRTYVKAP